LFQTEAQDNHGIDGKVDHWAGPREKASNKGRVHTVLGSKLEKKKRRRRRTRERLYKLKSLKFADGTGSLGGN